MFLRISAEDVFARMVTDIPENAARVIMLIKV